MTSGVSESGEALGIGGQSTVSGQLSGSAPWIFTVRAQTNGGDVVEDTWVIDQP